MVALVEKPSLGQKSETQHRYYGGGYYGVNGFSAETTELTAGINAVWPWWGSLLTGTYATYRAMARHSTIAKATADALGPILGSIWLVDADDDAPEEVVSWLQDNIISKRGKIIAHATRSIILGNSPFEVVWDVQAGRYVINDFVPLLPDNTMVLRADNGRGAFDGLRNGQARLSVAECLYILNRSDAISDEPGNDYGRSRYENVRDTAWEGWLDTARKLAELEDRLSGIVPIIIVPSGTPQGGDKTYHELAEAVLPSLSHPRCKGIVVETPAVGVEDADANPGKLKQLSTTVEPLDMGQRASSQSAMLEKLKYYDAMIARGMYRSERTMMATDGGTKADAELHNINAEPDGESINNMIAAQVNEQTARVGLTLNFGPEILKKVRGIRAAPLIDGDAMRASAAINSLVVNPPIATALAKTIDVDKLIGEARYATREGVKFVDMLTEATEAAQKPLPGEPPQTKPPQK